EIEAEFSGTGTVGFELRRSADGKPGIVVSMQGQYLNVGNVRTFVGNSARRTIRVFLDCRCIEVYVNDGAAAVYQWVDAAPEAQGLTVFAAAGGGRGGPGGRGGGGAAAPRLESLKIWTMT